MEPLTEQRSVDQPAVYGFLRLPPGARGQHTALREALVDHCRRHELDLRGVFTEHTDAVRGEEFNALVDALTKLPRSYGVVIPSPAHLGSRAQAAARRAQIVRIGARILAIRVPGGHTAPRGAFSRRPVGSAAPSFRSPQFPDLASEGPSCPQL
ncbi:hypothetical protein [Streptomyces sp. NPDC001889]